jgi:hypothetical protein
MTRSISPEARDRRVRLPAPVSRAFAQAHLDWALINKSGGHIIDFHTTYTLRLDGKDRDGATAPAIIGILAHSEDSAWKQRGVPIDW